MKRFRQLFIILAITCATWACTSEIDSEIASLKRRLDILESRCETINKNIQSLQEIVSRLNSYIYINSVTEIFDGKNVAGYRILFSDGNMITLHNGINKEDPIIGVKKGDDGIYYWTISYGGEPEFLYDEYGQKVSAVGTTPKVKIENDYWMITYDDGEIWKKLEKAVGTSGTSFVASIEDSVSYFKITLQDKNVMRIPSWTFYEAQSKLIASLNSEMEALQGVLDALNQKVYVLSVISQKENDEIVGYKIMFSNGKEIVVTNGVHGNSTVAIETDTDGVPYWTIIYPDGRKEWIKNNLGQKLKADIKSGVAPELGIKMDTDGLYYWTVTYSGFTSWIYDSAQKKVAAAALFPTVFSNVTVNDNYVDFNLADGTVVSIPRYPILEVSAATSVSLTENSTTEISFAINGAQASTDVAAIAVEGFIANIKDRSLNGTTHVLSGKVEIVSPATFTAGSSYVLLLVSDGIGHLQSYRITINYGI